jgi:hypothetical protein
MANYYVSSVAYTSVAQWAASTAYTVGQIVRQLGTPTSGNERCFVCTVAGTTAATEPAWLTTGKAKNSTTVDNTVTWTECTAQELYQGSTWAAPSPRLSLLSAGVNYAIPGDTIFVAANHIETATASITMGSSPAITQSSVISVICVDPTSPIPPTSANVTTGASVTATTTISFGHCYVRGIAWTCTAPTFNYFCRLENCTITTTVTGTFTPGFQTAGRYELDNVSINAVTASSTNLNIAGRILWKNSKVLSAVTGTLVTFNVTSGVAGACVFENCDVSNFSTNGYLSVSGPGAVGITFVNCKLPTLVAQTIPWQTGGTTYTVSTRVDIMNSDTGNVISRHERYIREGWLATRTNMYVTGGASDGTTPFSWVLVASGPASLVTPFESMPLTVYNTTVGTALTVTIEALARSATIPTNAQISILVSYLNSATTTEGIYTTTPNPLSTGTQWGASTAAWNAPARTNSTVYNSTVWSVPFSVSSNAGRVFSSNSGSSLTSASSLPAGYASLVDGGSVTDGGFTAIALCRFRMTASITPLLAGPIRVVIRATTPSAIYYIDPKIYLA